MPLVQRNNKLWQVGGKLTDDLNCCICPAKFCILLEGTPEGNDSAASCLDGICGCADFLNPYWPPFTPDTPEFADPRCNGSNWKIVSVWFAHDSQAEHNVWPWPEDNAIGDAVPYVYFESCCKFCDEDSLIEAFSDWYRDCVPGGGFAPDFLPYTTFPFQSPIFPDGCPLCLRAAKNATISDDYLPYISEVCDLESLDCFKSS